MGHDFLTFLYLRLCSSNLLVGNAYLSSAMPTYASV
jgi:hypothetical protein